MSQYPDTLASMSGFVRRIKPSASPETIRDWLNHRVRSVIDKRPWWCGLIANKVIPIPDVYSTGSIDLTLGSTSISGTSTAWATNDVVNTTIPSAISQIGAQPVTPASMAGITEDSILYIDSAGTPEVVAVQQVGATQFIGVFQYAHNAGATVTCSSLVNRQLRLSYRNPIFTILAVPTATSMIVDQPWGIASTTGNAYQICKIYITIDPKIKMPMHVVDPVMGFQLQVSVPQAQLMAADPWRQATDHPRMLADYRPNVNGNMQYELYPPPTTARQYHVIYCQQWPDMVKPGDRPPPFINPAVIMNGAAADALGTKVNREDEFVDKAQAAVYERKFIEGANDAIYADNSKAQQSLTWQYSQVYGAPGGSAFWQSHDESVFYGEW